MAASLLFLLLHPGFSQCASNTHILPEQPYGQELHSGNKNFPCTNDPLQYLAIPF